MSGNSLIIFGGASGEPYGFARRVLNSSRLVVRHCRFLSISLSEQISVQHFRSPFPAILGLSPARQTRSTRIVNTSAGAASSFIRNPSGTLPLNRTRDVASVSSSVSVLYHGEECHGLRGRSDGYVLVFSCCHLADMVSQAPALRKSQHRMGSKLFYRTSQRYAPILSVPCFRHTDTYRLIRKPCKMAFK